ncbi:hypothetical protein BV20DRAFT_359454 [Pilatotrama ljubarskyi]|nr:hypothetical protein BV20DRAFT_359454 [Pilatotrama ljubarskyi]
MLCYVPHCLSVCLFCPSVPLVLSFVDLRVLRVYLCVRTTLPLTSARLAGRRGPFPPTSRVWSRRPAGTPLTTTVHYPPCLSILRPSRGLCRHTLARSNVRNLAFARPRRVRQR